MIMRTKLWMLGVAVAALTSCTQSEVVEIPENRVIGFDTFVENDSRAVAADVNISTIRNFHVFGYNQSGSETSWETVFNNVDVTYQNNAWTYSPTKYWQTNHNYRFAAYADGLNSEKNNNVAYDATTDKLTITDYNAGFKDLIASISGDITTGATVSSPMVPLSFKHMLTKIGFHFYANTKTVIKISNVEIDNAFTAGTATYTYTNHEIAWDTTEKSKSTYTENNDDKTLLSTTLTEYVFYVIPQSNKEVKVNFILHTYDSTNAEIETIPYTASLATGDIHTDVTNTWKVGYFYKYYVTFGESFEATPIQFTVNAVDGWNNATDTQGTPIAPSENTGN